MIKVLTGCVVRIVSISPTGGAIFRLTEDGSVRSIRVIASSKVLGTAPGLGEQFTLTGSYVNHRTYGTQFEAGAVIRLVPTGKNIVRFLSANPMFSWLGPQLARKLWNRLQGELATTMIAGDYAAVAAAGGMACSNAMRLIRCWRDYSLYVQVSNDFATLGLPLPHVTKAITFWGSAASAIVASNPYALVTFASWVEIDNVCTRQLSISADDPRRLVAACVSCVEQHVRRGRLMRMCMKSLGNHLHARLGSVALASAAIDMAISTHLLRIDDEGGRRTAQPVGMSILEQALIEALRSQTSIQDKEIRAKPKLAKCGERDDTSCISSRLSHICCVHASISFPADAQRTVHIFPSDSMRKIHLHSAAENLLYKDVGSHKWYGDGSALSCYIHGLDMLDAAKATTLICELPRQCNIVIISPTSIEINVDSLWGFLHSSKVSASTFPKVYSQDCTAEQRSIKFFSSTLRDDPLHRSANNSSHNCKSLAICGSVPFVRHIEVPTWDDVIQCALEAFREAIDSDSALILTGYRKDAIRLNRILHEEHVQLRKALKLSNPQVRLYNTLLATLDEKIIARIDISGKRVFAGSVGTIVAIPEIPLTPGLPFIAPDLIVATVEFDTVGKVGLTAEECHCMDLAYAISADLDRWGAVAHRIFVGREAARYPPRLLASQVLRTEKCFTIVTLALARALDLP